MCIRERFYNQKIIDALVSNGGVMKAKDKGGLTPTQMPRAPPMTLEAPEDPDEDEYEPDDDDEVSEGGRGTKDSHTCVVRDPHFFHLVCVVFCVFFVTLSSSHVRRDDQ